MAASTWAYGAPDLPPFTVPIDRHDEIPAARAVIEYLQQSIELIDADLDHIAEGGQRLVDGAAGRGDRDALADGCAIRGDRGFVQEMTGRGAAPGVFADLPDGEASGPGVVASVGLGEVEPAAICAELDAIESRKVGGRPVVIIASVEKLQRLGLDARARQVCDVLLDNFAPAGGLLRTGRGASDSEAISLESVTTCVVGWALQAEMAAAAQRSRGVKGPAPMAAGRDYLHALTVVFDDVATASWPALVRAADRAATTIADGGRVLAISTQPLVAAHARRRLALDPLLVMWADRTQLTHLHPGREDLVIAFGADEPVGVAAWGEPSAIRRAGRGVCWVTCAFGSWSGGLNRGEWRLDPRWPYGEGLVSSADPSAAGHEERIAPAAGVVAETIYWLLNAAVVERLEQLRRPTVRTETPAPRLDSPNGVPCAAEGA